MRGFGHLTSAGALCLVLHAALSDAAPTFTPTATPTQAPTGTVHFTLEYLGLNTFDEGELRGALSDWMGSGPYTGGPYSVVGDVTISSGAVLEGQFAPLTADGSDPTVPSASGLCQCPRFNSMCNSNATPVTQ